MMFDFLFGPPARKINRKAKCINSLPCVFEGKQPKLNEKVTLVGVLKEGDTTYYALKNYGDNWFYAHRFKEIK